MLELRASFRWYVRFLQRKLTERALQKDGNGDGPAAGVMRQTILSVESELKQIDNAIAVAKSPWIFPSRRNPGRHVSRVNNAHDRLCEKAQAAGVELNFGSLRPPPHLRYTHGRSGDRPRDTRENPRP